MGRIIQRNQLAFITLFFAMLGLVIPIQAQVKAQLLYSCENCSVRRYLELGKNHLVMAESGEKLLLYDQQNLISDEFDGIVIQRLFVENETTVHAMSSFFYFTIRIKNNRMYFEDVLVIPPAIAEETGFNTLQFNDFIIGTQFTNKNGPIYLKTAIQEVVTSNEHSTYPYFNRSFLDRTIGEITYLTALSSKPKRLLGLFYRSKKRGKSSSNLYDYSLSANRLSIFDVHSNRFFSFDGQLMLTYQINLPAKIDWHYYFDYHSQQHYFVQYDRKNTKVFLLDVSSKSLKAVRTFQRSLSINSIHNSQIIFKEKNKKELSIYSVPVSGETDATEDVWQIDIEEFIFQVPKKNKN